MEMNRNENKKRVNCIFWPEALLSLVALSCFQVLFLRLQLGLERRRKSSSSKFPTIFIKMDNCFYKRDNCAHPVSFNYARKGKTKALLSATNVTQIALRSKEQIAQTNRLQTLISSSALFFNTIFGKFKQLKFKSNCIPIQSEIKL